MAFKQTIQLHDASYPHVITVSSLNQSIRELLEHGLGSIYLEGEISNLTQPASGHLYLTLKDAHSQIRAVMWRSTAARLKLQLSNGQHVLVRAKISVYEPRGEYQLTLEHVQDAGLGKLQRTFELLKQKLTAEGLFDTTRKQSLPTNPAAIGVITSPSGAAVCDVLSVLKRRAPHIPVILYPSLVQGADSVAQLLAALQQAITRAEVDVLLIVRGGGSLEDLWSFNNETFIRALATCPIPLVSGVGHETDITLVDLIADLRAPTPSVAAESATADYALWHTRIVQIQYRLEQAIHTLRQRVQQRYQQLQARLLAQHPIRQLQQQQQRVDELSARLLPAIDQQLSHPKHRLARLSRVLDAVSPLKILARGYSITYTEQGQIINSRHAVNVGERLRTELADGVLWSVVSEVS